MKDKKRKIIIAIIALLVLCIALIIMVNPNFWQKQKLKKINVEDKMDSEMEVPGNLYLIVANYKGDLTTEIMAKTYNNFAKNILPKYYEECKNLSSDEIKEYFNKKSSLIYLELGYEKSEDFELFINSLKNLSGEKLEFESYSILEKSVKKSNQTIEAYITIKYKDNNEIIFNSIVSDSINEDCPSIMFYTNVDKEIVEEDKLLVEQQEEERKNEESPFKRGTPLT